MSFFGRCCCLLLLKLPKKKMLMMCRWRGNAIPMRWKSEYRQQQRWLSNYTGRLLPMMIWHKSLWVEVASWIGYHTTIYRRRKHLLSRGAPSRAACKLCCALNTSQLLEESKHANPSLLLDEKPARSIGPKCAWELLPRSRHRNQYRSTQKSTQRRALGTPIKLPPHKTARSISP